MNTYTKIAALIFRLSAVGMLIYSAIVTSTLVFFMPAMIWTAVPFAVAGLVLFVLSIPLAKITTASFGP
jgi:hypothetical protein